MALEEEYPELGSAFETLWDLDPDFDEKAVVPLRPYIVAPVQAKAVRGGMVTHVTVIARFGARAMGLDHDCRQVAIGTLNARREMSDVLHYRTLEMASRAFFCPSPVAPCRLTIRWSGRVRDKVPSSYHGARAAQLNR
jgi:hypothetical protein